MLAGFPQFDTPAAAIDSEARSRFIQPEEAAWLQAQQQQAAAGFMHDAAHEQLLHHGLPQQQPSYALGMGFDQLSSMYMPHVASYGELVNQLTPMATSSMRARALLPALNIPENPSHSHLIKNLRLLTPTQSCALLSFHRRCDAAPRRQRHAIDEQCTLPLLENLQAYVTDSISAITRCQKRPC